MKNATAGGTVKSKCILGKAEKKIILSNTPSPISPYNPSPYNPCIHDPSLIITVRPNKAAFARTDM